MTDAELGPLSIRYAPHADTLLERLAAEHRDRERVCLVSSDAAVRGTSGQEVRKLTSRTFVRDLEHVEHREQGAYRVASGSTKRRAPGSSASVAATMTSVLQSCK